MGREDSEHWRRGGRAERGRGRECGGRGADAGPERVRHAARRARPQRGRHQGEAARPPDPGVLRLVESLPSA